MKKAVLFLTVVTVIFALCIVADAQQGRGTFTYQTIDVPGATSTLVLGINARGDITGSYAVGAITHGFFLSDGQLVTIDAPEQTAYATVVYGVSPNGELVGLYRYPGVCAGCPAFITFLYRGFVWSAGDFEILHVPGASYTTAYATNARGDVVGEYWADNQSFGYLLRGGVYTQIDMSDPLDAWPWSSAYGINAAGHIVGWYGDGATMLFHGYLLRNGEKTTIDLPGYTNVQALAINDKDEVIVRGAGAAPASYVWREGELTQIAIPGATWTKANGINDRGDIVGQYRTPDGKLHGFVAYK